MSIFILLLVGLSIYFLNVFGFFIGGDDIWLTLSSPQNINDLLKIFTSIQQYRPLPYSFFALYRLLPFNPVVFHTFSLIMLSLLTYLLYLFLSKVFNVTRIIALAIAFSFSISHIMFYNVFALAGIVDLIYLLFFFISLLAFFVYLQSGKKILLLLSLLAFISAIFSKEIFISIPIIITSYAFIFKRKTRIKVTIKALTYFWIPTIIFYLIKIYLYKPTDAAYTYVLSRDIFITNSLNFLLWFINFKHGWQMGMPLPVDKVYYVVVAIYTVCIVWSICQVFIKDKKTVLFFVLWGLAGLFPFFFLQRVLVFYLNVSLIALLSIIGIAIHVLYQKNKKTSIGILVVFFIVSIFLSRSILKQWLHYSFVATSTETAYNFLNQVYKPYDWKNTYNVLCLTNVNGDAAWATANGNEITMLGKNRITVFVKNDRRFLPPSCFNEKSLIFQNDGRRFIKLEK